MSGYDTDKLAAGDREEWTRLVTELAAELLPQAQRLVRRSHDAEDVVQAVLCALWREREDFQRVRDPRLYLRTCVLNRALSEVRGRARPCSRPILLASELAEALIHPEAETPWRGMELRELAAILDEAASSLRANHREVYRALREDPACSGREIARRSGCSHRTVQAALRRMRRCLDGRA